ncbi:MAG TPA: flagellar export chaperone FliS [Firmicutes bacterium]|nr:flagellar export chaperone FliS [Bacillota bacterium]
MTAHPYQAYKQNAVFTAGPAQLTLMLFDGALRHLSWAQEAMANRDAQRAHGALCRAQEIIAHLRNNLDGHYPISRQLDALYEFCLRRLVEANVRKDETAVQEVTELIGDLRGAWRDALVRAGGDSHGG